jgi:TolA-binding protein
LLLVFSINRISLAESYTEKREIEFLKALAKAKLHDIAIKTITNLSYKSLDHEYKKKLKVELAIIYCKNKEYARAIKILKPLSANTNSSSYEKIIYWLGESYYKKTDYNKAIILYAKAKSLMEKNLKKMKTSSKEYKSKQETLMAVSYYLAESYLKAEKFQKAASAFNKYSDTYSDYLITGTAKLKAGDSYYKWAEKLKKNDKDESEYKRKYKEALDIYKKIKEFFVPNNVVSKDSNVYIRTILGEARTLKKLGQETKAISSLKIFIKEADEIFYDNPSLISEVYWLLFEIYKETSEDKKAGNILSQLMIKHPNTRRALEALSELKKLDTSIIIPEKARIAWVNFILEIMSEASKYKKDEKSQLAAQKWLEAFEEFRNFFIQSSKGRHAEKTLYYFGLCALELKFLPEAGVASTCLNRLFPESSLVPETLFRLGLAWEKEKQKNLSLEYYRKITDKYDKHDYAHKAQYKIAKHLFDLGYEKKKEKNENFDNYFKKAEREFRKLIKKYPYSDKKEGSQYYLGLSIYIRKDYDKANEELEKYLKKYPEGKYAAQTSLYNAECLFKLKKYKKAAEKYVKTLTDFSKNKKIASEATYQAGWCYYKSNKFKEAEEYSKRFIRKFPGNKKEADVWDILSEIYLKKKEYKKAAELCLKVIKKYPKYKTIDDTYHRYGECLLKLKKFKEAAEIFDKLLKKNKKLPEGNYMWIAENLYEAKEYSTALTAYQKIKKHYNKDDKKWQENFYYQTGQCCIGIKNWLKAEEYFNKLFEVEPNTGYFYKAKFSLGRMFREVKKYKKSVEMFKDILSRPQNIEHRIVAGYEIGETYFVALDYQKAVGKFVIIAEFFNANLSSLKKMRPWLLKGTYKSAVCFENLKKWQKALDYYKKTQEIYKTELEKDKKLKNKIEKAIQRCRKNIKQITP